MEEENKQTNTPEQAQKPKKSGNIFGVIFLIVMTVTVLIVLFNIGDFNQTMKKLAEADGNYLLAAGGFLLAYVLIYPLSMCVFAKRKGIKTGFMENYLIGASEHFFNGITPYQTGAQPFQVYSMARRGVKASDATGVVIVNYVSFIITTNLFVLVMLFFSGDFFNNFIHSPNGNWVALPIVGFIMNALTMVFFLCIATCKWMQNFFKWCMHTLCKIKFLSKFLTPAIPQFDAYCENAQLGCKEAISDVPVFLLTIFIKAIAQFCYYCVPFFLFKALGIETQFSFMMTMFATVFAINAVVFIPTPGTSGGIETAFIIVFLLAEADAASAAILWRAFTYYFLMAISFVEYLLLEAFFRKKHQSKEIKNDSVTR